MASAQWLPIKGHAVLCAFAHKVGLFFSYIKTEQKVSVPTSNSIRSKSKWKYSVIDKTVTKILRFENLVFNCSLCLQQIADTC